MSNSHSIRITLNIKDKRIKFSNDCISHKNSRGIECLVYKGTLSPKDPHFFPKCGCVNKYYDIIKHRFKCIRIKLPRVSNPKTFLDLRKQRTLLKRCKHTVTVSSSIVKVNH